MGHKKCLAGHDWSAATPKSSNIQRPLPIRGPWLERSDPKVLEHPETLTNSWYNTRVCGNPITYNNDLMICGRDRSVATPWFMKSNRSWNFLETLNSTYFYFSPETFYKLSDEFWNQIDLETSWKLWTQLTPETFYKLSDEFWNQINLETSWKLWTQLTSETSWKLWNQFTPETSWKLWTQLTFTFRDKVETNFLMKHEL